ncbi:MAG: D-tyrosyl-tRNA(Tyr) deacylase [Blautia sp.]|nr:D-tyrosyl-tRNA(Tyr) deacylase [Blautia sp.]
MKFVIQRVSHASVMVDQNIIGSIGKGFLILIGIGKEDSTKEADALIRKMCNLRIFEDGDGKTNLALKDVNGEILLISQFTLYANCRKGNRPSFIEAKNPEEASQLYEYIIAECKKQLPVVQTGSFGADMKVELLNDGPFTVILDSRELM